MHSPSGPNRRALLRGAGAAAVAGVLGVAGCGGWRPPVAPPLQRLRLLGETIVPHRLPFRGTLVGGLSALDYDARRDVWLALSDDRSELQPARFYTLRLDLRGDGRRLPAPEWLEVTTLLRPDGQPFPNRRHPGATDPEGLRVLPDGSVLWTSEGDPRIGEEPALTQSARDGRHLRSFALPALLRFDGTGATGPRNNLTLEGLALTPDARTAWLGMEGPLVQDGPVPSSASGGAPARFTALDVASGRALRQVAYPLDAIPSAGPMPRGLADNGVSEILMLDAHRMLVLERAYIPGSGNSLRLYEIDTRSGSDTLALPHLQPGSFRPVAKTLVADFSQLGLSRLDNTEGMAWGPPGPDGSRTLVVVSDDNFNARQATQIAAFSWRDTAPA